MLQQAGACCPPEVLCRHSREKVNMLKTITKQCGYIVDTKMFLFQLQSTLSSIWLWSGSISYFQVTHDHFFLPNCLEKLTNECLSFISSTEPVAPGEESVGICCIKPAKVAQIHAQPHLEIGKGKE